MRIIPLPYTNPYFNLATEAYFIQESFEDVVLLWQSEKAVVCGKHQNLCAEVNYAFCKENDIVLARRLSGGGTVFHDMGNVNFTFIQNLKTGIERAVNYKQFLEPIREALTALGVQTTYSHRDDLLLNNYKISGNAQHVNQQNKRVLHHGTLLYDSALSDLSNALHSEGTYIGKSIASVRSQVMNIRQAKDLGETPMFLTSFLQELQKNLGEMSALSATEIQRISSLENEKFAQNHWILGYSPKYVHQRKIEIMGQPFELLLEVDRGIIVNLNLSSESQRYFNDECEWCIGKELSEKTLKMGFPNVSLPELLRFF